MTFPRLDNMTFIETNLLCYRKIDRSFDSWTSPADRLKIENPIYRTKCATYNTAGIINKLVTVFADCSFISQFIRDDKSGLPQQFASKILHRDNYLAPGQFCTAYAAPVNIYKTSLTKTINQPLRKFIPRHSTNQEKLYPECKNTRRTLLAP